MTPAVSVVMTVYNDGPYVREAVSSILAQTLSDFELVIVDDGSIDDSVAIIETFNDPRIRIVHQENAGLPAALNRGIEEARGRYIARHDADDVSDPERLARQFEMLERDPDLVLLGTNALLTEETGETVTETTTPADDTALRAALRDERLRNPFVHGSVMFRRDAVLAAGGYRRQFRFAQDFDLWLRLKDRGRIGNLREPLYRWRLRRGAVGTTRFVDQLEYARLALRCAQHRERGAAEPLIELPERPAAVRGVLALRSAPPEAAYELNLAKLYLARGKHTEARRHALRAIRLGPLNVYSWVLGLLTLLPHETAQRMWTRLRKLYRRILWWRKPMNGGEPH
ncbi:MAG TPA: glycosyltransferase [Thermoanaerobaculia bacterium]|nr:glycosyltransferase [Thermoanaerobaculia bacterium]